MAEKFTETVHGKRILLKRDSPLAILDWTPKNTDFNGFGGRYLLYHASVFIIAQLKIGNIASGPFPRAGATYHPNKPPLRTCRSLQT
jgi:hypothetical protein